MELMKQVKLNLPSKMLCDMPGRKVEKFSLWNRRFDKILKVLVDI